MSGAAEGHHTAHDDAPRWIHSRNRPDHDHVHDHDGPVPMESNPIWQQDNVELTSVGIDVGSSGTQVIFSRLLLRRIGEDLSSRFIVVRRDTWYESPVALTPYREDDQIDAAALGRLVDAAYREARTSPNSVDTGVVILTGEALRRVNAGRITNVLARESGELVCATAGHRMEALLAAYGSGAAQRSYEQGLRILNVDIGGGTTKLALLEAGEVIATAAVDVGGRLIAVDDEGGIIRLEPAGKRHARRLGHQLERGARLTDGDRDAIGGDMADQLIRLLSGEDHDLHVLAGPCPTMADVDAMMFSGGVAEFVYARETVDFGDLGGSVGRRLRVWANGRPPFELLPAGACIRATALGASEYSIQLSGSTGYFSDPDRLLPLRDLQVVGVELDLGEVVDEHAVGDAVQERLHTFGIEPAEESIALALRWQGLPSYDRLRATAAGIALAMTRARDAGRPVVVVLDADVARSLGRILAEEFDVPMVLAIDGIRLWDFDFVDIGSLRFPSNTVPVTIKSLLFSDGQVGRSD